MYNAQNILQFWTRIMTLIRLLFFPFLISIALSSCASLTKEECLTSDWLVVGERDGSSGFEPRGQFNRHVKACERVNVIPDHSLWHQGYQRGLVNYCTPANGLRVGQSGSTYHEVCPAVTETGFLHGYVLGDREHKARLRISSLESSISSLQNEIDILLDKLGSVSSGDAGSQRRKIDRKREKISDLSFEKEQAVYNLSTTQQAVTQFRRSL
jgi:hypothetical protein